MRWLKACVLGVLLSLTLSGVAAAQDCARYAAPTGHDANAGIAQAPFATVSKLAEALTPGQTGCLQGAFTGVQTIDDGGSPGSPITLRSSPGQTATINALVINDHNASMIANTDVVLDGVRIQRATDGIALRVLADRVTLRGLDVSNTAVGSVCVQVGGGPDRARDLLIEGSRMHSCSSGDYAVTFESSDRAVMRDTYIYGNDSTRAIQIYPDAQQTVIERVIAHSSKADSEAVHFGGDAATAPSNTDIRRSILQAPKAVTFFWEPGHVGTGNVIREGCVSGTLAAQTGWSLDAATTILEIPGSSTARATTSGCFPPARAAASGPSPRRARATRAR